MRTQRSLGTSVVGMAVALAAGCSFVNAVEEPLSTAQGGQSAGGFGGSGAGVDGGDGQGGSTAQGGSGAADCVPPYTTLENCGQCGQACDPDNVAGPSCATGDCSYASCSGAFQDCDEDAWNGCESNSLIDAMHCGSCEVDCADANLMNVTAPACAQGECDYVDCAARYDDCDGDRSNGCETEVTSLDECGACDLPCAPANATGATCTTGVCSYGQCADGYQDCDDDTTNGCESDPLVDHEHCGDCLTPCEQDQECTNGECRDPIYEDCQQTLQQGGATTNGVYWIDPTGGDPADAVQVFCNMESASGGWTACLEFVNTVAEDVNNNTWFDRCVDWTMASWSGTEIMLELRDGNGAIAYQTTGTRTAAWSYDNLTSTAAATSQYDFNYHTLQQLANGDQLMLAGKNSSNGGCHGSMGNGYGLVVYPSGTPVIDQPRLLVMPYRHQIGTNDKRSFGAANAQWFENNEISYDGTASWSTCGYPPAFIGTFRFYVR